MTQRTFTVPEIALIAGTRVALGAGIGLLLGGRYTKAQREGAGWALLAIGILTTIPILAGVLGKPAVAERPVLPSA